MHKHIGPGLGTIGVGVGAATGDWLALAMSAIVGYAPAAWAFLQAQGGIRGVLRTVWRGTRT